MESWQERGKEGYRRMLSLKALQEAIRRKYLTAKKGVTPLDNVRFSEDSIHQSRRLHTRGAKLRHISASPRATFIIDFQLQATFNISSAQDLEQDGKHIRSNSPLNNRPPRSAAPQNRVRSLRRS